MDQSSHDGVSFAWNYKIFLKTIAEQYQLKLSKRIIKEPGETSSEGCMVSAEHPSA